MRQLDKPWCLLQMKENEFFSKLTQPYICLRFSQEAILDIFVKLKENMVKFGLTVSDIADYPEYMYNSQSLQQIGIKRWQVPGTMIGGESSEFRDNEDFLNFHSTLQNLKVSANDIEGSASDEDVTRIIDPKLPKGVAVDKTQAVNLLLVWGPPMSGKRFFTEQIFELQAKFPIAGEEASFQILRYEDDELQTLTTDTFFQKIAALTELEAEDEKLIPGDWLMLAVPHTIDHLELFRKLEKDTRFSIRGTCVKLNQNDLMTGNLTPQHNLRRFFEEGFVNFCFLDQESVSEDNLRPVQRSLEEAFKHIKFIPIYQNKILWPKLEEVVTINRAREVRNGLIRKYCKFNYVFGEQVLKLDYRVPLLEEGIQRFKDVIHNYEGALLEPEPEEPPESK
jgi:hypothetical protein